MKILIIQPWIRQGGAENLSVYLAYYLQRWGHGVKTAALFADLTHSPPEASQLEYTTPPKWLARLCQNRRFVYFFGAPILFWLVLRNSKGIEVINVHNPPSSWVAVVIGKLRRIPVVWTCNELAEQALPRPVGSTAGKLLDRLLMKHTNRIIVLSRKNQKLVKERFGKKAALIRPGVDPMLFKTGHAASPCHPELPPASLYQPASLREALLAGVAMRAGVSGSGSLRFRNKFGMTTQSKFTLLTVGKLHRQKNQIVCLEALRKILPQIPEARLVIVGNGPLKRFLEERTREWGLEDRIRFVGFVSNEELRDLYCACDINLFPALDQSWGMTPFEALAAGKISIVSEDSGAAEVLGEENIGLACPPTAEAFAKKILEVYKNPRRTREMAARGRQYIKQNLTWESYAAQTLQILSSASQNLSKIGKIQARGLEN